MKTSELTAPALDWAVAKCEGLYRTDPEVEIYVFLKTHDNGFLHYSTDWAQGGPIIEREHLDIRWMNPNYYVSKQDLHGATSFSNGPTPLIAAMRCYVASKLGGEIEIPKELQ